jgi:hypothetical protein
VGAITGAMLDEAAMAHAGRSWGLADVDLTDVLDPRSIVASRRAEGGAAPAPLAVMIENLRHVLVELGAAGDQRTAGFAAAGGRAPDPRARRRRRNRPVDRSGVRHVDRDDLRRRLTGVVAPMLEP